MKSIIQSAAIGTASVVGMLAGFWLWNEVLEEKANDLKDRLQTKKKEKDQKNNKAHQFMF